MISSEVYSQACLELMIVLVEMVEWKALHHSQRNVMMDQEMDQLLAVDQIVSWPIAETESLILKKSVMKALQQTFQIDAEPIVSFQLVEITFWITAKSVMMETILVTMVVQETAHLNVEMVVFNLEKNVMKDPETPIFLFQAAF